MTVVVAGYPIIRVTLSHRGAQGPAGIYQQNEYHMSSGTTYAVLSTGDISLVMVDSDATAPKNISLFASTGSKRMITVVDGRKNSETYAIIIAVAGGGQINGDLSSVEISSNGMALTFYDSPSKGWRIL